MEFVVNFAELDAFVYDCALKSAGLGDLLAGRVKRDDVPRLATRHYAEIRAFIDIKLPERLRLCPYGAMSARAYFCRLYREENGEFAVGQDHAQWFADFCTRVGVSTDQLEAEVDTYSSRFAYLREEEPSREAMLRELAISYAWESTMNIVGEQIMEKLIKGLGFEASELSYFSQHIDADEDHSRISQQVLQEYVENSCDYEFAKTSIARDMIECGPWTD